MDELKALVRGLTDATDKLTEQTRLVVEENIELRAVQARLRRNRARERSLTGALVVVVIGTAAWGYYQRRELHKEVDELACVLVGGVADDASPLVPAYRKRYSCPPYDPDVGKLYRPTSPPSSPRPRSAPQPTPAATTTTVTATSTTVSRVPVPVPAPVPGTATVVLHRTTTATRTVTAQPQPTAPCILSLCLPFTQVPFPRR